MEHAFCKLMGRASCGAAAADKIKIEGLRVAKAGFTGYIEKTT
jgi:hypothetical protein